MTKRLNRFYFGMAVLAASTLAASAVDLDNTALSAQITGAFTLINAIFAGGVTLGILFLVWSKGRKAANKAI